MEDHAAAQRHIFERRSEIAIDERLAPEADTVVHRDLDALVRSGKFREDLFYRLKVISIELPPLRERIEDLPELVGHFLARYAEKNCKAVSHVSDEAMELLAHYSWPGNIRELQHAIERAVILNEGTTIQSADLLIANSLPVARADQPLSMSEMEKQFIRQSLELNRGNVTDTARALGLTRTALYRRMKRHGL